MALGILLSAIIIIVCVASSKMLNKLPALLLFIVFGMICGSDGLGIKFGDFSFAEQICSFGLIFIMFYGGFGTNWKVARPVAPKAILLSSLGVVLTAFLTGLFCLYALGLPALESFLIGSVISSTDAASVFSILRSKKLNLKSGLASLIEVESGSNDPTAYTLTIIMLTLMRADKSASLPLIIVLQVALGLAFGFGSAYLALAILKKARFGSDGMSTIFILAVALFAYALSAVFGGNGYLSVYIAGIVLGNSKKLGHKAELVHFFDGVTWLMQIVIFFLLGLLSFPSQMPAVLLTAVLIALFLTFIARPVAVALLMTPFKMPFAQQAFVAFAGLRGASSIVFALVALSGGVVFKSDVFHIVFCVALMSVAFQGTLLPVVANRLGLLDESGSVLKTFTDYADELDMKLVEVSVQKEHAWRGKKINEIDLPPDSLMVMIKREEGAVIPRGDTVVREGDMLVLSCPAYQGGGEVRLKEYEIARGHRWVGKKLSELDLRPDVLIVMIKREGETVIPRGDTVIKKDDVLLVSGELKEEKK